MAKKLINPFVPGQIVNPYMFAGRIEELEYFDTILQQTKASKPSHFMVRGERGIGKSSLLMYFQHVAGGKMSGWGGNDYKFINLSIDLDPNTSYLQLVRKVGSELNRSLKKQKPLQDKAKNAWQFLKRFEAFGVKYNDGGLK